MAGKKNMKIRTGARTASKAQEKELVRKARKLQKDYNLILPECTDHCGRDHYAKYRKKLEQVQGYADDQDRLAALAKKGDHLIRAYAGTISIANAEKAPYLAVFRTPMGTISFAMRGAVKKEKLIGVQYFDNPSYRLLAINDIVKKKKLNVYSMESNMVCSGKDPHVPDKFVQRVMDDLAVNLTRNGKVYHCRHLESDAIRKKEGGARPFLYVHWLSPGFELGICSGCLKNFEGNTYFSLTSHIASWKPQQDFEIDIIAKPIIANQAESRTLDSLPSLSSKEQRNYLKGKLTDSMLMNGFETRVQQFYDALDPPVFILAGTYYGTDRAGFIKATKGDPLEKKALGAMIDRFKSSLVTETKSCGKILIRNWGDYGFHGINAVIENAKVAKRIFKEMNIENATPMQILSAAQTKVKGEQILAQLPSYPKASAVGAFADEVIKAYKVHGPEEAERLIVRYKGDNTKIKSLGYAFLKAMGRDSGKSWQFDNTQVEYGSFLAEYAKTALDAPSKKYTSVLKDLLQNAGASGALEGEN